MRGASTSGDEDSNSSETIMPFDYKDPEDWLFAVLAVLVTGTILFVFFVMVPTVRERNRLHEECVQKFHVECAYTDANKSSNLFGASLRSAN